ncbi:MAG: sugar-transfer associated ATP-grasp domain-containing protein [Pseudomonadota bacterium]
MIRYAYRALQELEHYLAALSKVIEDLPHHRRYGGPGFPALPLRVAEQARLLFSNGIHAKNYYLYELYRKDLSWSQKQSFIGNYGLKSLFARLNERDYWSVFDDKVLFTRHMMASGLPVLPIRCALGKHAKLQTIPCLRDEAQVRDWFGQDGVQNIFIKPVDSQNAKGAISLGTRINGEAVWDRLPNGSDIGLDSIWAHAQEWTSKGTYLIAQDRVEPHPDLAAIVPNILHTVRVVTWLEQDDVKVIDAVLKMGKGDYPADNPFGRGGIVVPLDQASGVCQQPVWIVDGLVRREDHHPGSGVRVTGLEIPQWQDILDIARRAAEACSFHRTLAWDIGVTTEGPVLIEGNWCPDPALNQIGKDRGLIMTNWVRELNRNRGYKRVGLGLLQAWRRQSR